MSCLPKLDETAIESCCQELEEPDTEKWDFFVESNNVRIYRSYNDVSCTCMFLLPKLWFLKHFIDFNCDLACHLLDIVRSG